MTVHKLTAGSGYDYLTRQVAAQDATDKGHTGLADYYSAKGEAPGVWVGSGLAGIEGLEAGDVVTAEQMAALFGAGHHPLAAQRMAQLQGPDLTEQDYESVARLGAPYKVHAGDVSAFRIEVAKQIAAINEAAGLPGDWPVPGADRARVRTEVAVEFFRAEFGRDPADAREIAATIAKHSRPKTTAVAGYDLTFSPVKSVSALWAIADPATAAIIEKAHAGAVADALKFLESHALFTREGANGVRQVEVCGLVATAFTHRDSRAGDPDLHTHVAVANKVQTRDSGKWLAIDGRLIYKANVAASETYNTALEARLSEALGVRFAARTDGDPRKRPIREIVGVDPALNARWSTRRVSIEARRAELAVDFQATHGRPPTPIEAIQLAQQATLETREAKHEPRSLAEQRTAWAAQAEQVLGGPAAVRAMVTAACGPQGQNRPRVDAAWMASTASQIVETMQERRSTWQVWHVHAEALRRVRGTNVARSDLDRVVDLLVRQTLDAHSIRLTSDDDGLAEPAALRRSDSASVYAVAGAAHYTSRAVLAAEERIVARAGQYDGRTTPAHVVDLALLESTANGLTLNAGQAALVRSMATSGARLQLAIAPAGSGKTTAMRALSTAWVDGGGTVVGLAPSAAASAALGEQLGQHTDTLAKLIWSLEHDEMTDWDARVGPDTLVVIDEAGMADTMSLDAAITYAVGRGASIRLIGDDQQLSAIGAGGVLRDIATVHGASHLSELMRFADPAEAAASLALREGRPEALGYYLDEGRVHVGDLATITDDAFAAWAQDRSAGRDAVMLAPTRELASELNARARTHRLANGGNNSHGSVRLADDNQAGIGDVVLTRSNDRRLRLSGTDWVRNGDRWTVQAIGDDGSLTVAHQRNAFTITLPADYVRTHTELGYACTIHTAQGITADVSHTLLTGSESRQLAYTAATRGRAANHLYVQAVGDGDPHSIITPQSTHPATASEQLEQILARDESPRSATTLARDHTDPAHLLGQATARYVDALYVAGEHLLGEHAMTRLDAEANRVRPGLTDEPAWPTLRAHLVLLGAHGLDPVASLTVAAASRELDTADDVAAVLDWRLDESGLRNAGAGPLPWIPAVPPALAADATWGPYLAARTQLVTTLAEQVADRACSSPIQPAWVDTGAAAPPPHLVAAVEVWRAAVGVDPADTRPTGAPQLGKAAATYQRQLRAGLTATRTPADQEWSSTLARIAPQVGRDPFIAVLAERLAAISRAGVNAAALVQAAAAARGDLPDDHAAAALWWRISDHLTPAVAAYAHSEELASDWTPRLDEIVGAGRAATIRHSPWWPTLVTTVDHALARGNTLQTLLADVDLSGQDVDECQALVWRISLLCDDPASHDPSPGWDELDPPPADLWDDVEVPADAATYDPAAPWWPEEDLDLEYHDGPSPDDELELTPWSEDAYLSLAAAPRPISPLYPSDAQIDRQSDRAYEQDTAAVSPERIASLNAAAAAFYQTRLPGSWAQQHLQQRLGEQATTDPAIGAGYAPAGWTNLVSHLRRQGVSDEEMLAAGLATTASTGRLIDRFRDRAVFPITHAGQVLGFVGRRHPDLTDEDHAGPKYLNTAQTTLFRKGDQLFGMRPDVIDAGATPVIVEGPMDAIAVTIAGQGRYVGVAPLGTSLTEEQADQLAQLGRHPIVATDNDLAGQMAAHRDFWLLAQHGMDPTVASFPDGADPADLLTNQGAHALLEALEAATPLSQVLVTERLTNLTGDEAISAAAAVLAAASPTRWGDGCQQVAANRAIEPGQVRSALARADRAWSADPRAVVSEQLSQMTQVRARIAQAAPTATTPPEQRWIPLADQIDPRLSRQSDWPSLAAMLQQAHDAGLDVPRLTGELTAGRPLNELPAQDLRYRLVVHLPLDSLSGDTTRAVPPTGAEHERRSNVPRLQRPGGPRR